MAVAASSSSKTSEDNSFSTVSEVTLGIFPCNSGTCSSFSGVVFCCRQVLLVVRRLTSSSSRAASCFWCLCSAAFGAQVAGSK